METEPPRLSRGIYRMTAAAAAVLLVLVIVLLFHSSHVEKTTTATELYTSSELLASFADSFPSNCTTTCVISKELADPSNSVYKNARNWLCNVGMKNMGKSCSDFTGSADAPFNAYYQAYKASQGDKACCFGNSDGIHNCLAQIQTKCTVQSRVYTEEQRISDACCKLREYHHIVPFSTWGSLNDQATMDWWNSHECNSADCFKDHTEELDCCKLRQTYNIQPYVTWGSLNDSATRQWWNSHECNNADC